MTFSFASSSPRKNTRANRVRRMASKVAKLEKQKALKVAEVRLKAKLNALRK